LTRQELRVTMTSIIIDALGIGTDDEKAISLSNE
jgi:hypothetical protein